MESFPFCEELRKFDLSIEDICMLQVYVLLTDRQKGRVTFFHKLYYPEDKVMRWYDVAEKVVSYIDDDTFLSEQVHIDEIAEELADEMAVTAPKNDVERSDEQRPYKIELYKDDIDIILKSLRAANVPQDTYERIYETIGKADIN